MIRKYALPASEVPTVCSKPEMFVYSKYCIFMQHNKPKYRVDMQHAILNPANFQSGNEHTIVCITTKILIPIPISSKCLLTNNLNKESRTLYKETADSLKTVTEQNSDDLGSSTVR
jgi:hypothetical protein